MTRDQLGPLQAAVRAAVDREGLRPFAERNRIPLNVVRGALEARNLTTKSIEALVGVLGLEFYIGPPRDLAAAAVEIDGGDFARVPLYETTPSAGGGFVSQGDGVAAELAFRAPWLNAHVTSPGRAALFRVRGDSMAPTIPDRAVVLLDRARTDVRDGRVYVFRQGDELFLKRLYRRGQAAIVAASDNAAYPPLLLEGPHNDHAILGQVRWTARDVDG